MNRRPRIRTNPLFVIIALLLTACEIVKPPATVAGGAGIEGSGLVDKRLLPPFDRAVSDSDSPIIVLELTGEAAASGPLKAGGRFSTDLAFELRNGTARLQLPSAAILTVIGPARLQFTQVDGMLAPLLEMGRVELSGAGRIATPQVASLHCSSGFSATRTGNATEVECVEGALR